MTIHQESALFLKPVHNLVIPNSGLPSSPFPSWWRSRKCVRALLCKPAAAWQKLFVSTIQNPFYMDVYFCCLALTRLILVPISARWLLPVKCSFHCHFMLGWDHIANSRIGSFPGLQAICSRTAFPDPLTFGLCVHRVCGAAGLEPGAARHLHPNLAIRSCAPDELGCPARYDDLALSVFLASESG